MRYLVLVAFACSLFAYGLTAQPLAGTYTCANGNPGNAFDFGDIGDFFNEVEAWGMAGPVTLEVFDTGGVFTSNPNYAFGESFGNPNPVSGLGPNSRLTVIAASGHKPVVTGAGAGFGTPTPTDVSAMYFRGVGHFTLEGLTFSGISAVSGHKGFHGIEVGEGGTMSGQHLRIARCTFHDISGSAILLRISYWQAPGVIIENNVFWDCALDSASASAIVECRMGPEGVIRNNSIYSPSRTVAAFDFTLSVSSLDELSGNVAHLGASTGAAFFMLSRWSMQIGAVNHNVVYLSGGAVMTSGAPTWQDWRNLGYDADGYFGDPQFVSIAPGLEDLRLQPTSPAIDRIPVSNLLVDRDGNDRPSGRGFDSGAFEYPQPEMRVEHNSAFVTSGGTLNFGVVPQSPEFYAFDIFCDGVADLNLSGTPPVAVTLGANCNPSSGVTVQPPTSIPSATSASFIMRVEPAGPGPFDLTVTIPSNDVYTPYTFTIMGSVVPPNWPAVALPAAGSAFAGLTGGPWVYAVDPGAALTNASLELTDAEGDIITVTAITPPALLPAGVIAPGIPAPVQPLLLEWTGMADAFNAPGDYTWTIEFTDAGSGWPVVVDAVIRIRDLPPAHTAIAPGSGSAGNPYRAEFMPGEDSSSVLSICTVYDPNAGQAVTLDSVNPGALFQFSLSGGTLSVAPQGALGHADSGVHAFGASVTDGQQATEIHVEVLVYSSSGAISFTTGALPAGRAGHAYSATLHAAGGAGALSYSIIEGALPPGLIMNASGEISGIPTSEGTATITARAIDATNDTATKQFTIRIQSAAGTTQSAGSGCELATSGPRWALPLLAGLLMLWRRRRRFA